MLAIIRRNFSHVFRTSSCLSTGSAESKTARAPLVAQHLDPTRPSLLPEILMRRSPTDPLPFLPVRILWINLAIDGLPALSVEHPARDVMARPPRRSPRDRISQSSDRGVDQVRALVQTMAGYARVCNAEPPFGVVICHQCRCILALANRAKQALLSVQSESVALWQGGHSGR
jgi:hypothetical protein